MGRSDTRPRHPTPRWAPALLLAIAVTGAAITVFRDGLTGHARELRGACRVISGPGGEVLLHTSLPVFTGDGFVASSNRSYRVVEVGGDYARAEPVTEGEQPVVTEPCYAHGAAANGGPGGLSAMPLGLTTRVIVIYHTHTDESYVPGDGSASTPGRGGIVAVGGSLRQALESVGYAVIHDQTVHAPHDAMAYVRSRRTAYSNLKYQPYLTFDIHRDGGPASGYLTDVGGQTTCQILLVVGRQNPLMAANLSVARRIKAAADASYPGLIKGIFLARGHYNQDLDPGALLIEVGSEHVPRALAVRSMGLFAEVLARTFGAPGI
ncbi:MAG: stage II sporulation protein P [Firmicutes bacterium]|nr:stage II sporulation protein P [Bacillota bacterium]